MWKNRIADSEKSVAGFLAPAWYNARKQAGVSEKDLFEMVKEFCAENLPGKEIDDGFVRLLIMSYEA